MEPDSTCKPGVPRPTTSRKCKGLNHSESLYFRLFNVDTKYTPSHTIVASASFSHVCSFYQTQCIPQTCCTLGFWTKYSKSSNWTGYVYSAAQSVQTRPSTETCVLTATPTFATTATGVPENRPRNRFGGDLTAPILEHLQNISVDTLGARCIQAMKNIKCGC